MRTRPTESAGVRLLNQQLERRSIGVRRVFFQQLTLFWTKVAQEAQQMDLINWLIDVLEGWVPLIALGSDG